MWQLGYALIDRKERNGILSEENSNKELYQKIDYIAHTIGQARRKNRLTQQELGEKVGLSKQRIYRFENGMNSDKIILLLKIFKELGISMTLSIKEPEEFY